MASDDPFLQVQADVLSLLQTTRPLFNSYLRIRSSASSATSPELVEARQELKSTLTDLSADLQDLVDSVKAVEHDPYKYGLDIEEVSRRRQLVEEASGEVEDMHEQLNKTVDSVIRNQSGLVDPSSFMSPIDEHSEDDDYRAWEQQRQQEIMHEQDEALDGVFQTVGNLRAQADAMGRELEEQTELLEDFDVVADRVGGKLQTGLKKIGWVIRKNEDRCSGCCISVLIMVLILLLVLVLVL